MPDGFRFRVLVVDDEEMIRIMSTAVLESEGFEVRCAEDGFAALVELRKSLPDVLISDLRMPNMNGFELLSVVRRRFPHLPVIAISGEFNGIAPAELIADHFFSKGSYRSDELFQEIADLIAQAPLRPNVPKPYRAPVWIPKNAEGYFVLTCTDCLRSFSVPEEEVATEVRTTACPFCGITVRFLADPAKLKGKREGAG